MSKSRFSRRHVARCGGWWCAGVVLASCWTALAPEGALAQTGVCDIRETGPVVPIGSDCGVGGCRFGYSVAISGDGNTAMVGAYTDSGGLGGVYAYSRNGSSWVQQGARFTPTGGAGPVQYIGSAIALSNDGNTAVIGAYGDTMSRGAAYMYVRSGGVWSQQGPKIVPTGGAGAAQFFGFSVAISADGNTAIIGAQGDAGYLGAAHIFVRSNGAWSEQGSKLVPVGGIGVVQYFGSSVALTADGNGALVGASGDNFYLGAAYWFTRSGTTWTLQGSKVLPADGNGSPLYFGATAALSADGTTAAIGSYADSNFIGAVHIFTRSGTTWTQQGAKLVPTGNTGAGRLGAAISLSADGNVLLAGARSDDGYIGAAHVFRRTAGTWSQRGNKLVSPDTGGGEFGGSVAISADGGRGMVGAPAASTQAGAAYALGPVCPGDYDCDGQNTTSDLFAFLNDWLAASPRADFNNVNGRNLQDIFDFLIAWFMQCP
ncbi:MAG TPA: hypothetical protein VHC70_05245 [Phycisphaerales bacterium]|nr:hypothetical protein [Phycisphaerales bacterium]